MGSTMLRSASVLLLVSMFVAGCGDDSAAIRDEAYQEGYNQGAYDVCREVNALSEQVRANLRTCIGL